MTTYNFDGLMQKNPAIRFFGFINWKHLSGKIMTSRAFSYYLISDHAAIPHAKSLKDISLEVFADGYKTLDANRETYRNEALTWLVDWMFNNRNGADVTYEEISEFVMNLYDENDLRVQAHDILKGLEIKADFRFNGQYLKVQSVYDPDEKSAFFGWTNTHAVRVYNRTDNRYFTLKFNPKLEMYLPNSGKLNPNPDKLMPVCNADELKRMFAEIVEFGRLGCLTYEDFLFETCKEDSRETRMYYNEAQRVFLALNRVCKIRDDEHAKWLLDEGF